MVGNESWEENRTPGALQSLGNCSCYRGTNWHGPLKTARVSPCSQRGGKTGGLSGHHGDGQEDRAQSVLNRICPTLLQLHSPPSHSYSSLQTKYQRLFLHWLEKENCGTQALLLTFPRGGSFLEINGKLSTGSWSRSFTTPVWGELVLRGAVCENPQAIQHSGSYFRHLEVSHDGCIYTTETGNQYISGYGFFPPESQFTRTLFDNVHSCPFLIILLHIFWLILWTPDIYQPSA